LFWCTRTREGILIDPAGEPDEIFDILLQQGIALCTILLTHAHPDNLMAVPWLTERTSCEVRIHRAELELWEGIPEQCREFGWPEPELPEPHEWLKDGEQVGFGRESIQVVHLPGHSPGHCGFLAESLDLLFIGDSCFSDGAGRTDLAQGDPEAQERTLNHLQSLPESLILVPGHGAHLRSSQIPRLRGRRSSQL
jgi:glyoxylase-like metal-dependent hydrolase (beta-lactamase superfamily II)